MSSEYFFVPGRKKHLCLIKNRSSEVQATEVYIPNLPLFSCVTFGDFVIFSWPCFSDLSKDENCVCVGGSGSVVKMLFEILRTHVKVQRLSPCSASDSASAKEHSWRQQIMAQELNLHHPHGRPTLNSGVLALSWSSPECCGQLDNKTARGRSLCLSLCLSSQSDKRTASAEVPLIYSSIQGSSWEILVRTTTFY